MYHFFVKPSQINDRTVIITGDDVNHIRNVLRLRAGDEVSISNGADGREYRCGIETVEPDKVTCSVRFIRENGVELVSQVYLFQGIPKGDKMEQIIQKTVELGVYEIIPVEMRRCIGRIDPGKEAAKLARWQAISEAAAKQSKRGVVPNIKGVMNFDEALDYARDMDIKLVPYELESIISGSSAMNETRKAIDSIKDNQSIAIFIGPEGGFDESEVDRAVGSGAKPITLGRRILRTETAGMTLMSWIMYKLER